MMAESLATCALSIAPETLSAWRDKQVKAATAAQLDRHVPTCAACQHELTQFEMVARALYRQRELAPGNRIWQGVQAQINGRRQSRVSINSRAVMSGISGIIIVLLLGFVFARVLGESGKNTRPIATATIAVPVTTTPAPTPIVTGSATTTTTSDTVTIAQAWGANAAKQALTTPSDATHVFQTQNITRDGTMLLGNDLALANNAGTLYASSARAGFLDITTRQFTNIGITPPTVGSLDAASCCMTDGRFLVAEDNSQPGATCGVCHDRYWSYDLQTRQPARLVKANDASNLVNNAALDHGILALSIITTTTSFQFINLATQQTTTFTPPNGGTSSNPIIGFIWPYLVYSIAPANGSGGGTAYVYDVTTRSNTSLSQSISAGINNLVAITGDTLFYSQDGAGTFEVDHFAIPGAQPHLLTTYTSGIIGANARLVVFGNVGEDYLAWDRAEHQMVRLLAPSSSNGTQVALSGDFLIVIQPFTNISPQQLAIYDTSHLPTHG